MPVDSGGLGEEPSGASAVGGSSDRGHLWPHGLLRPDPGEPPAKRPTSATPQEIEFVPQVPTRWLEPKLLMLIAVQVALSTKFAEFFDRRDAHAHLPEATQAGAAHGGLPSPDRPPVRTRTPGGVEPGVTPGVLVRVRRRARRRP